MIAVFKREKLRLDAGSRVLFTGSTYKSLGLAQAPSTSSSDSLTARSTSALDDLQFVAVGRNNRTMHRMGIIRPISNYGTKQFFDDKNKIISKKLF